MPAAVGAYVVEARGILSAQHDVGVHVRRIDLADEPSPTQTPPSVPDQALDSHPREIDSVPRMFELVATLRKLFKF
jgi:hypothetical protein